VPDGRVAQLTVLNSTVEPYYGYRIYPVPEAVVDEQGTALAVGQQFVQNHAAYSADAFYPQVVAELGQSYVLREQIKQQLIFYPMSFNAAAGQLNLYRSIKVRIDFIEAAYAQAEALMGAYWQPPKATAALIAPIAVGLAASPLLASPISPMFSSVGAAIAAVWRPPEADGSAVYKIATSAEGIYRIDYNWLSAQGLSAAEINAIDLDQVRLFNKGEQVAIHIEDDAVAGELNADDFIEFYAPAIDAAYTKYSEQNIFWLTLFGGANLPKRMAADDAQPVGGVAAAADFADVSRHELDLMYLINAPGSDSFERWFYLPFVSGAEISGLPVNFTLTVADPVSTGSITISLFGRTATEHTVEAVINGVTETFYWSDIALYEATLTDVPLNDGTNTISLQCLSADGNDSIAVDYFEVSYQRDYVAEANRLKFAPDEGQRYQVTGFSSDSIIAFDISDATDVMRLTDAAISGPDGEGNYSIDAQPATLGDRYLVVTTDTIQNPDSLVEDSPSTLADSQNSADYIIITHRDIGWDESGDQLTWLEDLTAHRQSQGLRVQVADIEDIFDEFSYGIESPAAVKDFLSHAYANWQPPAPAYVLLVGDGTYDPKDNWNGADTTAYLPAYLIFTDYKGETVTDHWFVTFSGDDAIADMHIGRLPAADADQAAAMVDKIITYETTANTKFVNPDPWENKLLLIADNQRPGTDYAYEAVFEEMNDFAADLLPLAMDDPYKGYLNDYADANWLTDDIITALNAGVLMVNYSGHGSTQTWAGPTIFEVADVALLTNIDMWPFFVSMSCESGFFAYPENWLNPSLGEALLRSDAGAVAAFMPTGMTTTGGQEILNNALFEAIFTEDVRTLGPAVAAAKQTLLANGNGYYEQIAATFLLFGDPATTLKVPLPYRPTGVVAERLADGVRIRWNAATDCDGNPVAGYHIYRAATAAGPFSRINAELVTDTVYDDVDMGVGVLSGVGAGASAYYVVSSVDSTGTESVYSLAIEPAAEDPQDPEHEPELAAEPDAGSGSSSSGLVGCFIGSAAGRLPVNGWAVVMVMMVLTIIWFRVQGSRYKVKK
jgi:hypothetical protein